VAKAKRRDVAELALRSYATPVSAQMELTVATCTCFHCIRIIGSTFQRALSPPSQLGSQQSSSSSSSSSSHSGDSVSNKKTPASFVVRMLNKINRPVKRSWPSVGWRADVRGRPDTAALPCPWPCRPGRSSGAATDNSSVAINADSTTPCRPSVDSQPRLSLRRR